MAGARCRGACAQPCPHPRPGRDGAASGRPPARAPRGCQGRRRPFRGAAGGEGVARRHGGNVSARRSASILVPARAPTSFHRLAHVAAVLRGCPFRAECAGSTAAAGGAWSLQSSHLQTYEWIGHPCSPGVHRPDGEKPFVMLVRCAGAATMGQTRRIACDAAMLSYRQATQTAWPCAGPETISAQESTSMRWQGRNESPPTSRCRPGMQPTRPVL